jgi:predicted transcriptional regulator
MAANPQPRPELPADVVTTKPRRNFTRRSNEAELADRRAAQKWDADDGRTVVCFMDNCGIHLRELGSRPKPLKNHLLDKHQMAVAEYKDYCESRGWGRPHTTSLYARTTQHVPPKSETRPLTPGRQLKRSNESELAEIRINHQWNALDERTVVCLKCGIWMQNLGNRRCQLSNHLRDKHQMTIVEYKDYCESQGWGRPPTTALCARRPELTDEEKALRIPCPVLNGNGQPCGHFLRNLSAHLTKTHQMTLSQFRHDYPGVALCIPSLSAASRSRFEVMRQSVAIAAKAELERITEELAQLNAKQTKLEAAKAEAEAKLQAMPKISKNPVRAFVIELLQSADSISNEEIARRLQRAKLPCDYAESWQVLVDNGVSTNDSFKKFVSRCRKQAGKPGRTR